MTAIAVSGLGVVASTGVGADRLTAAAAAHGEAGSRAPDANGTPEASPFVLQDYDIRALLGRRGTLQLDRCTGFAVLACGEALADGGIASEDRERIGVSLGTTTGSLRSMSDYTRETLVEARPYLVNPGLFPNTVMNCAAGQAAIRHGLRGVNCTIAGGALSFFAVLRVAARGLRLGHLDATLAGAVEEFSPHRAWQSRLARANGSGTPSGEGAAVFLLERLEDAQRDGRHVDGLIESVSVGFSPGGETGHGFAAALERCAAQALTDADVDPGEIVRVAWAPPVEAADTLLGRRVARRVLGDREPTWVDLDGLLGDCGAATSALQVATILGGHRSDPLRDGEAALLLGWTFEGGVGAAVLRGFSRPRQALSAAA